MPGIYAIIMAEYLQITPDDLDGKLFLQAVPNFCAIRRLFKDQMK